MLIDLALLAAGLVVLTIGGEVLVSGAAKLARSLGLSALVVGLTIVAFGTSAPELAVSIVACLSDTEAGDSLAIGNVVGSNIANVLLVLGLAAATRPIQISKNINRLDAPIMLAASALFALFAYRSGAIERWEGAILAIGLVTYVVLTFRLTPRTRDADHSASNAASSQLASRAWYCVLIVLGLIGLKFGADLIVSGATGLAVRIGVSERIVGLTIVAIGTSLPEIATTIAAARRGEPDIAIGNVVGSNIFNVLSVLGIAGVVAGPITVAPEMLRFDLPVMLATVGAALIVLWSGWVTRLEGAVLVVLYGGYLAWLVTSA